MEFSNNKFIINIKQDKPQKYIQELNNIIFNENVVFLPFTHNNELSANEDVLCVQDMKRTYNGKTYITYGYKLINNHIQLVNSNSCDGYLLVSKRVIRSIPELQRIKSDEINKIAKSRIDKIIPQINAFINNSIYVVDITVNGDMSWNCCVFTDTLNGVKDYLKENTPIIDNDLDELIDQIK